MAERVQISPDEVHESLAAHVLTDGMKLVLDLQASRGSRIVDARSGLRYLDMYTFFASAPLGLNPAGIVDDPAFMAELAQVAVNKPANPDMYTTEYAEFVETFTRVVGDPALPHLFFVEGGALAVENALKIAFDWKSRQNEAAGRSPELGTKIMHLTRAFHGRSGYTMSLTNTEPIKTARFPKFDWPRIDVPAITFPLDEHLAEIEAAEDRAYAQARAAFEAHPHDIAAFIAEPIQGEGGDNHIRPEFFRRMAQLVHDHDALLIFDEVQTGMGTTGTAWAYQQLGVQPGHRRLLQEGPARRRDGRRPGRRGGRQRVRRLGSHQLHLGRRSGRHGPVPPDPGDHRDRGSDRGRGRQGRALPDRAAGHRRRPPRSGRQRPRPRAVPGRRPGRPRRPGPRGRGPARSRARDRAALRRAVDPVPPGTVGEQR